MRRGENIEGGWKWDECVNNSQMIEKKRSIETRTDSMIATSLG